MQLAKPFSGLGILRGEGGGGWTLWGLLSTASAAVSGYHGYKRNDSLGWGIGWFLLGGLFPILTPVMAVAQGFGKRRS